VGATGQLLDGLTYDAYGSFYYVTLFNSNSNYLNYANVGQALIATGTAANPVCVNPQGNCVPYNIFTQGGVTAAQLAYLDTDGSGYGTTAKVSYTPTSPRIWASGALPLQWRTMAWA
jgi:iron complex outermembrane receptor protein